MYLHPKEKTLNLGVQKIESTKPIHKAQFSNKNRIWELDSEIGCALDNMDIDCINKFENEINILCSEYIGDPDISMLVNYFKKSKQEIIYQIEFEKTKEAMKKSYMDFGMSENEAEIAAEDFAWQELYEK